MATYIKTETGGNVSYEIQPDEKQIMLPNIKDVYPAAELETIFNSLNASDISDELTFTSDDNTTFTLQKAVKTADVVFIQCSVTPNITLSTAGALNVVVDGLQPALENDSRLGVGLIGPTDIFFAWLQKVSGTNTIKFKKFVDSTWTAGTVVDFTLIIPVGGA